MNDDSQFESKLNLTISVTEKEGKRADAHMADQTVPSEDSAA